MKPKKTVFVTVGTTSFDALVQVASSRQLCQQFQALGYSKVLLQIGRGVYEPEPVSKRGFTVEYYRYKDSIAEDIKNASLIISHAGAGSVLESLGAGKPLIVVINQLLMGNHQMELAYQLYLDGHLLYATCCNLLEVLSELDTAKLKPFPPGDTSKFSNFLDKAMGLS
ncbi:UDP-N-acetylglucosamine transferase subunit ALG13 homolog [Patiria miniata]|uniref:UDP-N-acetylglucosamine transferase subunit ALG13 n=1 Tax=Patiria miniata TaxID=46514 RepID=A0A913YWL5_PATMI|nr:UDP-N-acetylglucosamine transferase subunit ALG13 homolog [Patiria miniata]